MRKLVFVNLVMAILIITSYSVDIDLPVTATASDSFFVSQDGSDSGPGTEDKPWRTIQKAAESAVPGSTVYIKAGTYFERINIKVSGKSAETPVVFRNFEDDTVIIDGSQSSLEEQEDLVHISNQSYVHLIGLEITNNTGSNAGDLVTGIGIWGTGEGIEIRNCRIHQISYTGSGVDSGAQAIAVYGRNGDSPISGLVIDGNEIWDIQCGTREAVALNGNVIEFEVTNNYIHDNNNTGLAIIGGGMIKGEPVCSAEAVNRARNGFVSNNIIERNNRAANPSFQENDYNAGGIYAKSAANITIANNRCMENDIGIKVGSEAKNKECESITVRDNLIYDSNSSGIQAGGNDLHLGWASDCRFLNNTLYSNDKERQGRGEINILKSRDLYFNSNIVYTGPQNLAVTTAFGIDYVYNIFFHNNIYYGPGGSRGLRFAGVNTGLVGLNMWRQKTGQDVSSKIADPRFTDAVQRDFRLLPDSPAIDFGDPAYVPETDVTDFAGEPRFKGRSVDSGAYEF